MNPFPHMALFTKQSFFVGLVLLLVLLSSCRFVERRQTSAHQLVDEGFTYYQNLNYSKALENYSRAIEKGDEEADPSFHADILYKIGQVYARQHHSTKALSYYKEALKVLQSSGQQWGIGVVYGSIGIIQQDTGQFEAARVSYQKALDIRRLIDDQPGQIKSLINIGSSYLTQGRYSKALEYYEKAKETAENCRSENYQNTGDIYTHMGVLYGELGQFSKALAYHEKAIAAYNAVPYPKGVAAAYHNKGYILAEIGQYDAAIEAFHQALFLREKMHDSFAKADTFNNLGLTLSDQGKNDQGLEMLMQAEQIFYELNTPKQLAATLDSAGTICKRKGEYARALNYYGRSLEIWLRIDDLNGERITLGNIGSTMLLTGSEVQAIALYKMAVNISQEMRRDLTILPQELQRSYTRKVENIYRKLADMLINVGRLAEAEYVLSLLKEEEFFNFMRQRSGMQGKKAVGYTDTEQSVVDHYLLAKASAERRKKNGAINKFLRELTKEYEIAGRGKEFGEKETKYLGRVQGQLKKLEKGTVLLHTFRTDKRLRLLLTTADKQVQQDSNIEWSELNQIIGAFRMAIKQRSENILPLAQHLYDVIIRPIDQVLKTENVVNLLVSLDDALRYLPIYALHDGSQFLCQRFKIDLYIAGARDHLTTQPKPQWSVAGLGVSESNDKNFGSLPAVYNELDTIVLEENGTDKSGVFPGVVHLNNAFTLNQLWRDIEAGHPVIHIASHFKFNPTNRDDSFLLLGGGQRLTLEDFKNEGFPLHEVDLLTLSACDTAIGVKGGDGREVESLAVLALELGAKAVMATLWQVDDASTSEFMVNFYQFRKQGLTKAEAFQKAQVTFIECEHTPSTTKRFEKDRGLSPLERKYRATTTNTNYSHPYYWAPYILMGNFL